LAPEGPATANVDPSDDIGTRTAPALITRRRWAYRKSFWHFADLYSRDLGPRFGVENRNVVSIRVTHSAVFSVRSEDNPIGTFARHQASGYFMGLEVINVNAIV
jgi:hypothetical protein